MALTHVFLDDEILDPFGAALVDGPNLLAHVHKSGRTLVPDVTFLVQAAADAGHRLGRPVVVEQGVVQHVPAARLEAPQGFTGIPCNIKDLLQCEQVILVQDALRTFQEGEQAVQFGKWREHESGFPTQAAPCSKNVVCSRMESREVNGLSFRHAETPVRTRPNRTAPPESWGIRVTQTFLTPCEPSMVWKFRRRVSTGPCLWLSCRQPVPCMRREPRP